MIRSPFTIIELGGERRRLEFRTRGKAWKDEYGNIHVVGPTRWGVISCHLQGFWHKSEIKILKPKHTYGRRAKR